MVIDRVCEGYSGFVDTNTDVMTSPVNLWSFYGCSSPGTEPGHGSPWKPSGECEESGSTAGSPERPDSSFTGVNGKLGIRDIMALSQTGPTGAPKGRCSIYRYITYELLSKYWPLHPQQHTVLPELSHL